MQTKKSETFERIQHRRKKHREGVRATSNKLWTGIYIFEHIDHKIEEAPSFRATRWGGGNFLQTKCSIFLSPGVRFLCKRSHWAELPPYHSLSGKRLKNAFYFSFTFCASQHDALRRRITKSFFSCSSTLWVMSQATSFGRYLGFCNDHWKIECCCNRLQQ